MSAYPSMVTIDVIYVCVYPGMVTIYVVYMCVHPSMVTIYVIYECTSWYGNFICNIYVYSLVLFVVSLVHIYRALNRLLSSGNAYTKTRYVMNK